MIAVSVSIENSRELLQLEKENPFERESLGPDAVRFVSILSKAAPVTASLPVSLPPNGEWLVRIIAQQNQFVFGAYRLHMKTITYLGQIDRLFGVPATTQNSNTIMSIVRILKSPEKQGR